MISGRSWFPDRCRSTAACGWRTARPPTTYAGAAAVSGFRVDEADSGKPLLGWERLETGAAKLSFSPFALELGDVVARAPEGRLVIEPDGSVNVSSLRIEEGVLHFADRSLDTPFEVGIHGLSGTVTGFSTEPGDPALIALSGTVGKYGSARIRGTMNLANPTALADVRAELRNIDLALLTPYVAKFAGYRVRSGRVSAELHYSVRNGQITGQNDLVFRELVLGEKVEREGLESLPLDLMVALLADSEGRIDLDIPVKGNLADPQFDLGGLVARAIGAAVRKIVSAPFRALASLFGADDGGEDEEDERLAAIRFAAGSAELRPPEEEDIAKLAQALVARPGLGVTVHAGYDPQLDAAELRHDSVRRAVLRRASYPAGGPLEVRDPAIVRSAEALYRERIGDPRALRRMVEDDVVYARALIERLAAEESLEPDAMAELARKRAGAVRDAFAAHGVDPDRVATVAKEGAPTELELTAGAAIPSEADVVRAAQRGLHGAGFAAGPVDGILGPKTEAALRAFQVDQGLHVSGTLDPPTLAALGLQPSAAAGR
jgi:outer membrane protein OmpA-like peptidoglycan-associated protein